MSVIGKQIKKFRIEKGITQEQLGELAGVTTQAVSRWERGGTPDAELLPDLARILDVSIDTLFGREEQSLAVTIAHRLCQMNTSDAYRYAFDLCWAIEIGLLGDRKALDDFLGIFIDNRVVATDMTDYFCKMLRDGGVADVRLSPDLHHFFLMVEPQEGLRKQLCDIEKIRRVFEVFADRKMLDIIFFMYSRLNTPLATSLISKHTHIPPKEVDKCMDKLVENNLAIREVIETADGSINSYMFRQESSVIPLLCFADEICIREFRDFIGAFDRTKPLL